MIITVASGKGGTGKTTVAAALALSLVDEESQSPSTLLVDCDVEAPNAALFVRPLLDEHRPVKKPVPEVHPHVCDLCGRCAEVCAFHAVAVVGQKVLVFRELCHGCGSCASNCPTGAIREVPEVTGSLERGRAGPLDFAQGTLHIGTAMPVPAVHQLKKWVLSRPLGENGRLVILDAPPGTSCPMVATMRDSDFVLLVTEPTPFGLHDLRLAVQVARDGLHLPVGVVLNRGGIGNADVDAYCSEEGIPVLLRIPNDRRIAEAYSSGVTLIDCLPEYRQRFVRLYESIGDLTRRNTPSSSTAKDPRS